MSYTVLARRYRSRTFDEVVGQGHIAQTLKRALTSGRIAHAYLFCGTRGTGKTSTARILAKALNCHKGDGPTAEPCGECSSCQGIARGDDIDVIEIDAASNTGVDNIRDLIDNAQYRPTRSRFKVYIIDEVHMLSKNAFNALLKTLEEPPEHVKFILATTEPEKVLATILSRCQRYDFRNIPTREIAGHLREICKNEKIEADDDALLLVAKAGAGSMRDSLSLLDRLLSVGEQHLTVDTIEQLLGLPKSQVMFDLAEAIGTGDVKQTLARADAIVTGGLSVDSLLASLVDHLRNLLVLRACGRESNLVEVPGLSLDALAKQSERFEPAILSQDIAIVEELRRQVRTSQAGRALLDATLVRLALAEQFTPVAELLTQVDGGEARVPASAQKKKPDPVEPPAVPAAPPAAETPAPAESSEDEGDDLPAVGRVWDGPKVSLATVMTRTPLAAAPSAPPPPAPPADADGTWAALLGHLGQQGDKGKGLSTLISLGQFGGADGEYVTIRFPHAKETIVRMLEKNGKKEQLREALTTVLGRQTGVRFEVEPEAGVPDQTAGAAPLATPRMTIPTAAVREAAPEPAPVVNRLTPELRATLEADPLIKAVLEELGGTIIKVE